MSDITNEWRELRSKLGDLICHIDGMNESIESKMKKLQEKEERQAELQAQIDEAYNKGLQDMYDACCILAKPVPDIRTIFGSSIMDKIILNYSPQEIIDKVVELKNKRNEAQNQELHVGDEIEYMYPGREPEKCIVVCLDNGIADEKIIWIIDLDLSQITWFSSASYYGDSYRKTGKHYDSIPLKKEEIDK